VPKIVLAYSRYHFDPSINQSIYGTGYISSSLWRYLHEVYPNHEILYTDYNEPRSLAGVRDVDLFIGLSQNFQTFTRSLKPGIACLWSVNKSAVYRQGIRRDARKNRVHGSKLVSEDGIYSNILETVYADYVVTLGGWSNYKSFTNLGMKANAVYALGIGFLNDRPMKKYRNGKHILMFVGTLSFRKGIHLIEPILAMLKQNGPEIKLIVIGRTQNFYWQDYLERLRIEYSANLIWEQAYIEPDTKEWDEIFSKVAFGVFPSFEEGAAGALAQIIHEGVPVLYSNESGFEYTENSIPLTMSDVSEWIYQIERLLLSSQLHRKVMLDEQQVLLKMNGLGLPQIKKVLTRISQGSLWPGIADSSRLLVTDVSTSENEYRVLKRTSQSKELNSLTYTGLEPLGFEDLARLGIMTLDRYPSLMDLLVSDVNSDQDLIVSHINSENFQGVDTKPVILNVIDSQKSSSLPLLQYSKGAYRQSLGRISAKMHKLKKFLRT